LFPSGLIDKCVVFQGGGMLLFREVGVAFVHVPKTCGKSLRSFLSSSVGGADHWWGIVHPHPSSPESLVFDKVDRAHYTAEMIREFHGGLWEEMSRMRVFSVAREPYRRSYSAYRQFLGFFKDSGLAPRVATFMDYLRCIRDELYRTERDGYLYIHGVPQVRFHLPNHELIWGGDLSSGLSGVFGRDLRFGASESWTRRMSSSEMSMVEWVYSEDFDMWERLTTAWPSPAADLVSYDEVPEEGRDEDDEGRRPCGHEDHYGSHGPI
jgi:hypothetical protein